MEHAPDCQKRRDAPADWHAHCRRRPGSCLPTPPSSRDSERDLPLPPSYRGGQLVVEYATVCFRSQEDFGPGEKAVCRRAESVDVPRAESPKQIVPDLEVGALVEPVELARAARQPLAFGAKPNARCGDKLPQSVELASARAQAGSGRLSSQNGRFPSLSHSRRWCPARDGLRP